MTKRISEVATHLKVSTQTIHNYIKLGTEFFSENATRKTRKRFNDGDIQQLTTIKQLLDDGLKYEDIPDQLTPAPRIVDDGQDRDHDQPDPKPPPKQTSALEQRYQELIAVQQHGHEREIRAKDETIAILKDENDRLRTDLDNARLPWFRRIFGNTPK